MQVAGGRQSGRETGRTNEVCWPWFGLGVFELASVERWKRRELTARRQRAAVSNQEGCRSGASRPNLSREKGEQKGVFTVIRAELAAWQQVLSPF